MDPQTITLDPDAAARARTTRTRAVIACHLHGICADIPALRRQLPDIGICEDASQAFGAFLDGRRAGRFAEVAVISLGPGKHIDAGEGGILLCRTAILHKRAITVACHPLRNLLAGTTGADPRALAMRPHPMAAVLALHQLAAWSPNPARAAHAATLTRLAANPRIAILGDLTRHGTAKPYVPVLVRSDDDPPPPGITWVMSGAQVLAGHTDRTRRTARALLRRVRIATLRAHCAMTDGEHEQHATDQEQPAD